MAMTRIFCDKCGWTTNPHYSGIDCVKEKEIDHAYGFREKSKHGPNWNCDRINGEWYYKPHDSAFGKTCPRCGKDTAKEERRYFPQNEIDKIRQTRETQR